MARIAFVIPNMGGGGAERVTLNLLSSFVDRGHLVDLVLMQEQGELLSLIPDTVRIIDLQAERVRDALFPLIRYLRAERPDAMQVSMWPLTIVGILAARIARTGTRVVATDHSTLSRQYCDRPRTLRFLRWSTAAFYPRADAVVAVSQGAAHDLRRLSGLDSARVRVIANPVPVPPPDALADRAVKPVWQGVSHRIIAVGKFKPEKNFALLLAALSRVNPAFDWRLVLLGEGPTRAALEDQARALGVAGRIVMPGFVTDPAPYYRTATHFVLSSDFEGLPTVIIEALHAGLTVVSTDCPSGPREILGAGGEKLVPVGDTEALTAALNEALALPSDPARQRRRGALWTGNEAVDRYSEAMGLAEFSE